MSNTLLRGINLAVFLLLPATAGAQYTFVPECLPNLGPSFSKTASPLDIVSNETCTCVKWYCYAQPGATADGGTPGSVPTYCGLNSQLHLVGSRIQTIMKAADPLKSLSELGKRITLLPLSAPELASCPK